MSTTGQSEAAQSSRQRGSSACPPLIDAATKDLFRKNAFRITGLSVDASTREVAKHADKLKMLVELGQDVDKQSGAFSIRPPPGLDEIREAIEKLKEPEKRLIDEFFWFWPEEFGASKSDPGVQAVLCGSVTEAVKIWSARENDGASGFVAKHNLAVLYHLCALDLDNYSFDKEVTGERQQKITNYWKGAFSRWEHLATNEYFWDKVTARIRQLNEPNLPTGFTRRMRATLPEALDKINAELAVAFAKSGKIELARLHIQFMHGTHQGLDNVEKTAELVLTPDRNRLKEQIQRANQSAQQNPATAHEAAGILIEQARPLLDIFALFFGEQEHFQKELFDEAATAVVNCLVAYQRKTGDNETFVKLLERTLPLAESVEVRRRIEDNIGIGKHNVLYGGLTPISSAPSLSTVNGIGFTLYGFTDPEPTTGSFLTTYYFVFLAIPIFPISRYRVIRNGKAYRFFGKAPLRPFDKWHLAISIGLIIWLIIVLISAGSESTPSSQSTYTLPPAAPSEPAYTTPPASGGGNSDGNVYRVPSSVRNALDNEKAELETERTAIEAIDAQVEALGREIQNDRLSLDSTSQSAVDDFNAKVELYNALVQKDKNDTAAYNEKVNDYNAKLRQYGQ